MRTDRPPSTAGGVRFVGSARPGLDERGAGRRRRRVTNRDAAAAMAPAAVRTIARFDLETPAVADDATCIEGLGARRVGGEAVEEHDDRWPFDG